MRLFLFVCLITGSLTAGRLLAGPLQNPAAGPASPTLDSLRRLLATAPADTHRLTLLDQLYHEASLADFDILPYAHEGLQLAQRLKSRPHALAALSVVTMITAQHQDYLAATRYAQQLLRMATQVPVEYLYAASAATSLGNSAGAEGNYPEARRYFWQGIRWAEAAPLSVKRLRTLAYGYSNLAGGYIFQLQRMTTRPDSLLRQVRYCIQQSQRLAYELRKTGDEQAYRGHLANSWDALADLADLTNRLDSALYYKRKALVGFQALGDVHLIMTRQQHLANLELSAGHAVAAAALARQAQQTAHANDSPVDEADASETLANALDRLGRGHEAFSILKRSYALRDTALGADKRAALARLQVSFDTELKEARIRELTERGKLQRAEAEHQRQRAAVLVGGLLLLALALAGSGVLYWRLRRSGAQLAALSATKDRLYALVAHDLRGPVQALGGLGNMISYYLRRADIDALTQLPPLISQAVGSVNQLLDNLLHWAASQTGELRFQPTAQPVALVLDECATLWATTALANQIELRMLLPAPNDQLWADSQMVRTVLRNLVGNALKFTPTGGTVTLEAAPAAHGGHTLRVTDTGPGLSAADVAILLGPEAGSTRLRRAGARGEQGTGLGLRLCQLFMHRHGGTLELHGRPGQGTTAQVWFPG